MEKDLEIYVERKGRQETRKQMFMSQQGLSGASGSTPLTAADASRRASSHVTHPSVPSLGSQVYPGFWDHPQLCTTHPHPRAPMVLIRMYLGGERSQDGGVGRRGVSVSPQPRVLLAAGGGH